MIRFLAIISIFFFVSNCSNQTIISGKILNQDNLEDLNFKNKENLIEKMGYPSFTDPIENKFFYYSEKKVKKSIFSNELIYSYIFVFKFDKNDNIEDSSVYDLKNNTDISFIDDETDNEVVKRGLIERIFGSVGPQEITTAP